MNATVPSLPYLEFFGLNEAPFRLAPDTACFFSGAQRGRTLQALLYAVSHSEGIIRITGEVGAGKTMLCRMLLQQLPEDVDIIYLAVPSLDRREVLRALARELELDSSADEDSQDLLERLQEELIARHAEGQRVALLVDEAHAMPVEALEQIRLLSNLETGSDPLLQIVLFGQPELDRLLEREDMRALRDRIAHSFFLEAMRPEEVASYLEVRLRAAGFSGTSPFGQQSVKALTRHAKGMARRVNILADRSLLAAYSQNSSVVLPRHVRLAVNDGRNPPFHRNLITALTLLMGILLGVLVTCTMLKVMH